MRWRNSKTTLIEFQLHMFFIMGISTKVCWACTSSLTTLVLLLSLFSIFIDAGSLFSFKKRGRNYKCLALKIQFVPEMLQKDSVLKWKVNKNSLLLGMGNLPIVTRLWPSSLWIQESWKINDLSKLVLSIHKGLVSLGGSSLCYDLIHACINLY